MKQLRARYSCPVELALDLLGGKWKTVILARLKESPLRYGELRALLPGLSEKVLTERLKELEAMGLITRNHASSNERTPYRLTEKGENLRPILDALYRWGQIEAEERMLRIG